MPVRVVVQQGPKQKKAVAFAVDWPGWSRGARTPDLAFALLEDYRERYRPVVARAGLADELDAAGTLAVVERSPGTPSTDFWGISFSPCGLESEPMPEHELDRALRLLTACWEHFDAVAARVTPQMRKGPRGGGRDRDAIIGHTVRVESLDFASRVGVQVPEAGPAPADLPAYREEYLAALRTYNTGEGKRMRSGNLPFLIRHTAFHVLDHAWEMEDKDLSGEQP